MKARILAFAGSARRDSLNKKLVAIGAAHAREAGAEVTLIDLDDFPMPIYHGDIEAAEGMPGEARRLRALFMEHDGLLVASPENNSSVSSLLKNAIDWLSRSIGDGKGDNSGLAPYRGKVAAIMAASPSPFGGTRGLPHLRQILASLGVTVVPSQIALQHANQAFQADGSLKDPHVDEHVRKLAHALVDMTAKLREVPPPPRMV
jgi:chromate reductase, NAD(P)H dehydrogenase (quinone)